MATYTLIQSVTVGSGGAASIDFTSIPSTYTDLVVKLSARTNRASFPEDYAKIEFNGSAANLSMRLIFAFGSTPGSTNDALVYGAINGSTSTANTFGTAEYYIANYAGSDDKTISIHSVSENNTPTEAVIYVVGGLWDAASAITSIKLLSYYSASFDQHTTATLYGISKN
jgi:hypothetical protein